MTRGRVIAGSAVFLAALFAFRVFAYSSERKGEIIDRIVAVVEDRAVLRSELEIELRHYMLQENRSALTEEESREARKKILDGLVADLLMTIHAEKEGVEVGDGEVDSEVKRMIDENRRAIGGEEAFERQLETEGMTLQQLRLLYREKVKARMLIQRLMYREVMGEIQVAESEARDRYRESIDELPKRPETVNLAHIVLIPKASAGAGERALAKIREIEGKLKAGEDFPDLAMEFSEGPSAKNGGSLGYMNLGDLDNPVFEDAVRELTVGETSAPVLTEYGYHIIKLEDVDGDRVLVRHILVRVECSEDDIARTGALADSIRQELLGGADFAEMASRFSDDHGTKDRGGAVGEIPLANLPEFVRNVIGDLGEGEIAPVIKERKGFRIVKVLGRTVERTYTFEEAKGELKKYIEQEKLQEKFQEYVEGLKSIYYVDIKGDF